MMMRSPRRPQSRREFKQMVTEEAEVERIIAEELKRRGWTAVEFRARPKSDAKQMA